MALVRHADNFLCLRFDLVPAFSDWRQARPKP
jgi:hypothetical protein